MTSVAPRPTIATGLSLQHNSLNFLRVAGALAVIAAHSPSLTNVGETPRAGAVEMGIIPVSYFFVISGFLITASRHKLPGGKFTARRLARILPGYWLCLVVTGLGLAWVASLERGGWSLQAALGYIARNWLFLPGDGRLGTTLHGAPDATTWNGSVWTIPMELFCYLVIGCAVALPLFRKHLRPISTAVLVCLTALGTFVAQTNPEPGALYLVTFFATGIVLYAWREKIPLTDPIAAGSAVVVAVCFSFSETVFLATLPFGYLVLWFGARAPGFIKKIGAKNDISYGVYVYAWPVQQVLTAYGLHHSGLLTYNLLAMLGATVLGWISWLLVERPATEWVRVRTAARPRPRADVEA